MTYEKSFDLAPHRRKTSDMKQRYHTIIRPDRGGSYIGWVEELPGALTSGKSIRECQRNLRDAFVVAGNACLPAHVVLVDDVMTTGATLHAAARALHAAGVSRVDAWVCARVA